MLRYGDGEGSVFVYDCVWRGTWVIIYYLFSISIQEYTGTVHYNDLKIFKLNIFKNI